MVDAGPCAGRRLCIKAVAGPWLAFAAAQCDANVSAARILGFAKRLTTDD